MLLRPVSRHTPLAVLGLRRPSPIASGGAWSGLLRHDCDVLVRPALRCRGTTWRGLHEDIARKNHYERLNLRHDASPAEIKKSVNPTPLQFPTPHLVIRRPS